MVALTRRGQDVLTVVLAAGGIALLSVGWAATAPGDDPPPEQDAPVSAGATPTDEPTKPPRARKVQPAFVDDFESGLDQWRVVGSTRITDSTSSQGRRSAMLTSTKCGGDAFTRPVPVRAGSTYRLRTDYRTDGDGGFIGLSQFSADGTDLAEKWLIGDGGAPTDGGVRWRYNVDERDPDDLEVWGSYTATYVIPEGVASVSIKIEDWGCGGLPDDPATSPVYFDRISWTLVSKDDA